MNTVPPREEPSGHKLRKEWLEGVTHWLGVIKPMLVNVEKHTWVGPANEQTWNFMLRSTLVRQYEAMLATTEMVKAGHGPFAVTFLRTAFEELVWIEYLKQVPEQANEIILLLARLEMVDNLSAQNEFAGARDMAKLGFTQRYVKAHVAQSRKDQARLREIGRALGWKMDRALLPSVLFLARKVGRERDYHFLYQGTSRFVHFSTNELFRRVWGQSGSVKIGSKAFGTYWDTFALYWGFRIFLDVLLNATDILTGFDLSEERTEYLQSLLRSFRLVPIVTREELLSWKESVP